MSLFACKARKKAGNVLFLILLAVVLFAALAYAVTSSMRGGGKDAKSETAQSYAAAMINFVMDVQTFVTRAQMLDNVKDDEFSFQVDANTSALNNYLETNGTANCYNRNSNCTRAACRVFSPYNPNGLVAQKFEKYADPTYLNGGTGSQGMGGNVFIRQIAVANVGTSAPEPIIFIPGLKPEICNEINKQLGLNTNFTVNDSIDSIGETQTTSRPEQLATSCGLPAGIGLTTTRIFGDEATQFAGKRTFCAPMINGGNGVGSLLALVHVLIER